MSRSNMASLPPIAFLSNRVYVSWNLPSTGSTGLLGESHSGTNKIPGYLYTGVSGDLQIFWVWGDKSLETEALIETTATPEYGSTVVMTTEESETAIGSDLKKPEEKTQEKRTMNETRRLVDTIREVFKKVDWDGAWVAWRYEGGVAVPYKPVVFGTLDPSNVDTTAECIMVP